MDDRFALHPAERAAAVEHILDLGLPERRPVRQTLSLPVLFFGVEDCLFLAVLLAVLLTGASIASVRHAPDYVLLALLFMTSPALYGLPHLLTLWKDAMSGTLEWKRTCRVSLGTVLALRMLAFGGLAAAVSVPCAVLYWRVSGQQVSLAWLLGLSASSLFLYAALSLALLRRGRVLTPPVLWLLLGLFLLKWERSGALLLQVPALVFFLLAGAGLGYCLLGLAGMLNESKGGLRHAVR